MKKSMVSVPSRVLQLEPAQHPYSWGSNSRATGVFNSQQENEQLELLGDVSKLAILKWVKLGRMTTTNQTSRGPEILIDRSMHL